MARNSGMSTTKAPSKGLDSDTPLGGSPRSSLSLDSSAICLTAGWNWWPRDCRTSWTDSSPPSTIKWGVYQPGQGGHAPASDRFRQFEIRF